MRFFDWVWTFVFFSLVFLHHLDGIIQKDKEDIIYDQFNILGRVMAKVDDNQYQHIRNLYRFSRSLDDRATDLDDRVTELENTK